MLEFLNECVVPFLALIVAVAIFMLFISGIILFVGWIKYKIEERSASANPPSTSNKDKPTLPEIDEGKIIYPDTYSISHYERVNAGDQDEIAFKLRWKNEIEPLLPSSYNKEGITVWTAKLFFYIVTLPSQFKGGVRDDNYHICHFRYSLLDFCIYSFFDVRLFFCRKIRRHTVEKIENLYFDFLSTYFSKYFDISVEECNVVIDSRIRAYDEVMQTTYGDANEELLRVAVDFMCKDFEALPRAKEVMAVSANTRVMTFVELTSIMKSLHSLVDKQVKKLPPNCLNG